MMLASAIMEIVGIGMVMPVIALLSKPELIEQNKYLRLTKEFIGPSSSESFIFNLCLVLIVVFILKNAFLTVQNYVQARFIYAKGARIASQLFDNYLHAPYKFHLTNNAGQLMGTLSLANNVCHGVLIPLMILLTEAIVVVCVLAMLLTLAPLMTLCLACVVLAISALVYFPFRSLNKLIGGQYTKEILESHKIELQGLKAVKESKLRNVEDYFSEEYSRHMIRRNEASANITFMGNMPRFLIEALVVTLGIGALAILVISGKTLGSITLILSLFAVSLIRIMPSMSRIQYSLTTIRHHQNTFQPLYDTLFSFDREDKKAQRSDLPYNKEIRIDAVSFKYGEESPDIFKNFSLNIPRNSSTAFIGPTGCGKTTLVDIVLGLLKPNEGAIRCDGVNIEENLPIWQKRIGYVPQFIFLLDDTVKANVAFGLPPDKIDEDRVRECLRMAQILDFIETLPKGVNNLVGENGIRLSGGQRQRVGIARALYHNPEILVLDEATSALDNDTERAFVDALQTLKGTLTILMVAHRMSTVQNCDSIVTIGQSKV